MIILLLNLLIANIFLSTGISKINNHLGFVNMLKQNINLPYSGKILHILSVFIILTEIILPCMLFIKELKLFAVTGLGILLVCFNLFLFYQIKGNNKINCHCGGFLGNGQVGISTILRNTFLFFVILVVGIIPIKILPVYSDPEPYLKLEPIILLILTLYTFNRRAQKIINEVRELLL